MRSKWGLAAGGAVTVVFLVLAFYRVDLRDFWTSFRSYDAWWAVASVAFFAASVFFRAVMWRITTGRMGPTGLFMLFGGVVVGYMANNLLPFRAGELVRPYYLARRRGFPYAGVLSTVVIERVTDVVVLGLLLAGTLAVGAGGLDPSRGRAALGVMLAVILLAGGGALVLGRLTGRIGAGRLARLVPHLEHFLTPLRAVGSGGTAGAIFALGVLAWAANWVSVLALLQGVAYHGSRWMMSLLLLLFVNLGVLIPSSPGAFGVMQMAFIAALYPFGVARAAALAVSFIYQFSIYVFTLGLGLPLFLKAQLSLAAFGGRRPSGA